MRQLIAILSILFFALHAHSAETSLSRYSRSEHGVLAKEYDMEGGRAYWINGISIMGLPDAGADIMGFSEPARRLPLGFAGLYSAPPVYERYGLSLNASNGRLVFKENYNPIDTPVTELLWERYGLEGNTFRLNFNRQMLDSVVFSLGIASHSTLESSNFYYQDIVHQLYTGTMRRDSVRVPLAGRNLGYNSFHAVPSVSWLFPNSSITAQLSFLWLDNEDATRNYFEREPPGYTITFPQSPYKIKGGADFYRLAWSYRFLPDWELSLSHRLANQELKYSKLDTAIIYFLRDEDDTTSTSFSGNITETYTAQTGEWSVAHKTFLNPYVKVSYEYLRNKDSTLYQDRQLILLGINEKIWRIAFRGESGVQRNASALDSVKWAPAFYWNTTLFLPWHLQFSFDFQEDTRFPDMHETHIMRVGRLAFPNKDLLPERRQRTETSLTYKLSEHFFYGLGFRYERALDPIVPYWLVSKFKRELTDSIPADTAFMWVNTLNLESNELFMRCGLELGNWRLYAERGQAFMRTITSTPARYYKGAVNWSNRFVEDRLKVSVQFDADWFDKSLDYAIVNDTIAVPVELKKYLSLNFKSSMQIQDFILYAKIENMNHSLMEPEVGYTPPGIRFAYGIEWILGD